MQIKISINDLRMRADHSTSSENLGFASPGTYEVYDVQNDGEYTWYRITPLDADSTWVAGVSGVFVIEEGHIPAPEGRDILKNQIYIATNSLRIRTGPSTKDLAIGFCEKNCFYNVYETKEDALYTWYRIDEKAWCAGVDGVTFYQAHSEPAEWKKPEPEKEDTEKNQVYVGDVVLNIRYSPSTSGKKMGTCTKNSNYYVFDIKNADGYNWYKIGTNAWIAAADENVIYYPGGSPRIIPHLKAELERLRSLLSTAKKSIDTGASPTSYEELYRQIKTLNDFIDKNLDPFEYDVVDNKEYDGIDILYTADVHGAWVDYSLDGNYMTPVFSYKDVGDYAKTLENRNIKTFLVDAGDWSRPSKAYNDYLNTGILYPAEEMRKYNYLLATYGNHEWRWSQYGEADTEYDILDKLKGITTACNLFKNGNLVYRPYRAAKIGSKKVGIIGIGYPSANGNGDYSDGVWTYGDYQFYDDKKLFAQVQKYIDLFKENNFDYIVTVCHMCKSSYESDSRYKARTDTLIENTNGLTAVIQGHYNFATNAEIIKDKGNNNVLLAHESGANLNSFGRLMLRNNTVASYLLDEQSDLNMV